MNKDKIEYYKRMLAKGRLIPVVRDGKVAALITFYIGNGNCEKYVRDNPWSIVDDEPDIGTTCYIDQFFTNRDPNNARYSWPILQDIIDIVHTRFPQVNLMRWNRYKGGNTRVYKRIIKRG